MFYMQHFPAKFGFRLVHRKADLPAHHQIGHSLRICLGHVQHIDQLAAAKDGAAVCDLLDLFQLMRDQDDGLAVIPQAADDLQEEFDLLGRQYGSGLVEDQDLRLPVQHLKDLDALLHGDVDLFDHLGGFYFQAEFTGEFQNILVGLLQIHGGEKTESFLHRFHSHNDILGDRIVTYQLKMLVYHTDIQFGRVIG